MALVLGTNTYVSEAESIAYCSLMGLTPLADAETYLTRATKAMDVIYGARYLGDKADTAQALEWPRTGTDYLSNVLPARLKDATVAMALLLVDSVPVFDAPEPQITKESIEVDVIKKTREFASSYAPNPLHSVSQHLATIIGSSVNLRLVRG